MSLVKELEREKRRLGRSLAFVGMISVLASLCLLILPLYLYQIYHRVIVTRSIDTLIAISLIAVVLLLTFGILDAVRRNMLAKLSVDFEARLSSLTLAGELSGGGDVQRQTLTYITNIRQVLGSGVFPALFDLPVTAIFVVIIFLVHPVLGAIVSAGLVLLLILAILGELTTRKLARETQQRSGVLSRRIDQVLNQQELIKSLGLIREGTRDVAGAHKDYLDGLLRSTQRTNRFGSASRTVRQLIQIGLIGTGAALVIDNQIVAGVIFASSIIASRALAPIEQIVAGWGSLKMASLNSKLLEMRLARLELKEKSTPLPRPKGRLGLEKIFYAPAKSSNQAIIKGVVGLVEEGSTMVIVGPSGSGKSTLARCMVGYLKPSRGRITLDGQDLEAWDPVTRGIYMGYMPQTVEFFEATVRENIARMRRDDDPAHAVAAAKFVGVHDMIMGFPDGYDTVISPAGFMPSGGQKQLLALARAFYGHPAIVVLDEPNSSLDRDGEKIFHGTLRRAKAAGITVIVITQRLSVLQLADRVLMLKAGMVEKFGSPEEVMNSGNVRALPQGKRRLVGLDEPIEEPAGAGPAPESKLS